MISHKIPEKIENLTLKQIIQTLENGNTRFINGLMQNTNFKEQINNTNPFKKPFAIIISCMDSRIPISSIFDQKIGHIYNICIPGNFITKDIIGSLELACINNNIRLIVVIGHNECNAIKSACDNINIGHITRITSIIKPSIIATKEFETNRTSSNKNFIEAVTNKNIELSMKEIHNLSPLIRDKIKNKELIIKGATYNIYTGNIKFLEKNILLEN